MDFLVRFGRSYLTKDDLNHRFEIFAKNYEKVLENNKINQYVKYEINHLADLTEEEFYSVYANGLILKKDF